MTVIQGYIAAIALICLAWFVTAEDGIAPGRTLVTEAGR